MITAMNNASVTLQQDEFLVGLVFYFYVSALICEIACHCPLLDYIKVTSCLLFQAFRFYKIR